MSQYKLQIMIINKLHKSQIKFVCNYVVKNEGKNILHVKTKSYKQCLGSGSVGSARFGFLDPDPDPRGKISTKNCKKTFFTSKSKI